MMISSYEQRMCSTYLSMAEPEQNIDQACGRLRDFDCVIVADGFEQRSTGALVALARNGLRSSVIALGSYKHQVSDDVIDHYTPAAQVSNALVPYEIDDTGTWVARAIQEHRPTNCLLDITGLSGRGIFGALDSVAPLARAGASVWIAYSDANEYWPLKEEVAEWVKPLDSSDDDDALAATLDKLPWLYSSEHRVELVAGHEGYTVAASNALVAFLAFKCARLAAVVQNENYSECVFLAGLPRFPENKWRAEFLKQVNRPITRGYPVLDVSTFGYKDNLEFLVALLFGERELLSTYDVHLGIMGSKLQTYACWVLSSIIKSITVLSAVPGQYFPQTFSRGTGATWVFPFTPIPVLPSLEC